MDPLLGNDNPEYEDSIDAFRGTVEQAVIDLRRRFDAEVRGLRRCNRFACKEIDRLQEELDAFKRAHESTDELIKQHDEYKLEVKRLQVENAKLQLTLSGTQEQLAALVKVVG